MTVFVVVTRLSAVLNVGVEKLLNLKQLKLCHDE